MIEAFRPPVGCGMTRVAASSFHLLGKLSAVAVAMARFTPQVCIPKHPPAIVAAHMAVLAQHRRMCPVERETGGTMSGNGERCGNKPERRMARFTPVIEARKKISTVIVHVAISTRIVCQLQRRPYVGGSALVAFFAGNHSVFADEFERRQIMIEFAHGCAHIPTLRCMTGATCLL